MAVLRFTEEAWRRALAGDDNGGPFYNGVVTDVRLGTTGNSGYGMSHTYSRLIVFSGTLPTKAAISDPGNTQTSHGTPLFVLTANNSMWSEDGDTIIFKTNEQVNAIASGTASFWMIVGGWYNNGAGQSDLCAILAGDITTPGGGGSLVMSDTNIVSGNPYTVSELRFSFPRVFG